MQIFKPLLLDSQLYLPLLARILYEKSDRQPSAKSYRSPICKKLKPKILWLESKTYYKVSFLSTRVGCHLSEDRNREGIGNLQVLGCLH